MRNPILTNFAGAWIISMAIVPGMVGAQTNPYAHLRSVEGNIDVRFAGDENTRRIEVDQPLGPGDVLTTELGSRAELVLPDGSILWVDEGTRLELVELAPPIVLGVDEGAIALQSTALKSPAPRSTLPPGSLPPGSLPPGSLPPGSAPNASGDDREPVVRVDTPGGVIGVYDDAHVRIDVDQDGYTHLTCEAGSAALSTRDDVVAVRAGQRVSVVPGERPDTPWRFTASSDSFDRFVAQRLPSFPPIDDGATVRDSDSADRSGPDDLRGPVLAYDSTLRSAGTWVYHRDYSTWVWQPRVASSWQPYSDGRWVTYPDGVVWIAAEPWGFVTHHYGAWDWSTGFGWYWFPGSTYSHAWVEWYELDNDFAWCPRRNFSYRDHHGRHHDVIRRGFDYDSDGHRLVRIDGERVTDRPVRDARVTRPPHRIDRIANPIERVGIDRGRDDDDATANHRRRGGSRANRDHSATTEDITVDSTRVRRRTAELPNAGRSDRSHDESIVTRRDETAARDRSGNAWLQRRDDQRSGRDFGRGRDRDEARTVSPTGDVDVSSRSDQPDTTRSDESWRSNALRTRSTRPGGFADRPHTPRMDTIFRRFRTDARNGSESAERPSEESSVATPSQQTDERKARPRREHRLERSTPEGSAERAERSSTRSRSSNPPAESRSESRSDSEKRSRASSTRERKLESPRER